MKKQILILTVFVAAILGGMNAFGQSIIADGDPNPYQVSIASDGTVVCPPVVVLDCADGATLGALHPQAGVTYEYNVTTSTPTTDGTDGDRIHWFVITDGGTGDPINVITAINNLDANLPPDDLGDGNGSYIAGVTETGVYNTPTQRDNSINISWKPFDGIGTVVLLVAYVVDESGCTDNIEVYRIMPVFNFTLDIAALADDGSIHTTNEECVSPVESAVYNAGTGVGDGNFVVDYGENWVFFGVTAANFSHSWQPVFDITYSGTPVPEASWAYSADAKSTDPAVWHTIAADGTSTDPVLHTGTELGVSVGADEGSGECIVVRVRIDHDTEENPEPTTQTLHFGVNGTMYDAGLAVYTTDAYDDLGEATATDGPCVQVDFDDNMDYLLTPRPSVTTATPLNSTDNTPQDFEPKNVTP